MTPVTRAIRARLAGASAGPDDRPLRIAASDVPLHMTNPHVGTGPLGGAAFDDDPDEAVFAQRQLLVDDEPADVTLVPLGRDRFRLVGADGSRAVVIGPARPGDAGATVREVLVDGFRFEVETQDERLAGLRERAGRGRASVGHTGPLQVKAIIPGKVVSVSVAPGDAVTAGQQLLVVEAMKMQNELRAPRDGTIERVGVAVGVNIELGDLLVVIS